MNITEALSALDPATDEDWTKDGLPAVEAISDLVGETVTRAQITEAAPNFSRTNTVIEVESPEPEVPAEPGTDPDALTDEGDETGEDTDQEDAGDDDDDDDTADEDGDDTDEEGGDDDDEDEDDDAPEPAMGRDHPDVLEAAEEVAAIEAHLREGQKALKEAQDRHAALLEKHAPRVNDAVTNQKGIMSHIESQMKVREARAGLQQVAAAALGQVATKAPIDQVAARKVGHGHERKPARLMGQSTDGQDT